MGSAAGWFSFSDMFLIITKMSGLTNDIKSASLSITMKTILQSFHMFPRRSFSSSGLSNVRSCGAWGVILRFNGTIGDPRTRSIPKPPVFWTLQRWHLIRASWHILVKKLFFSWDAAGSLDFFLAWCVKGCYLSVVQFECFQFKISKQRIWCGWMPRCSLCSAEVFPVAPSRILVGFDSRLSGWGYQDARSVHSSLWFLNVQYLQNNWWSNTMPIFYPRTSTALAYQSWPRKSRGINVCCNICLHPGGSCIMSTTSAECQGNLWSMFCCVHTCAAALVAV